MFCPPNSHMCVPKHQHNYLSVRNKIQKLVTEEMYYRLILTQSIHCKTIHDKLIAIYLIACANLTQ